MKGDYTARLGAGQSLAVGPISLEYASGQVRIGLPGGQIVLTPCGAEAIVAVRCQADRAPPQFEDRGAAAGRSGPAGPVLLLGPGGDFIRPVYGRELLGRGQSHEER